MSQTRQTPIGDGFAVRSLSLTYRDRHRIEAHAHPWGQLIYVASGLMRVSTEAAAWLAPPTRAVWIAAGIRHAIETRGATAMRTLYVAPEHARALPADCRALEVEPLLRELILHIVRRGMLDAAKPEDARLTGLLIDLLDASATSPLSLPLPRDPRARRLAERLLDDPTERTSLVQLSRDAGASVRTLQRTFAAQTGLTLDAWRMRARLQRGVVLLAGGASVTVAALEVGYASPSAFIAAFKRVLGVTPAQYRSGQA